GRDDLRADHVFSVADAYRIALANRVDRTIEGIRGLVLRPFVAVDLGRGRLEQHLRDTAEHQRETDSAGDGRCVDGKRAQGAEIGGTRQEEGSPNQRSTQQHLAEATACTLYHRDDLDISSRGLD